MKRFGIVSYNIYCNFTNYGSALQSYALQRAVDDLGEGRWESLVVDYCPDILRDKDPKDPIAHMWDTDEALREQCRLSLPAIRKNADRFDDFYRGRLRKTQGAYTKENFAEIVGREGLDGFICGSDTIFCVDEFGGFEDGYYAQYPCMREGYAIAYAASFGDAHFTPESYVTLAQRLQNFKAIGLREEAMLPFVRGAVTVPAERVLDPTLLLSAEDYAPITAARQEEGPYLLLYSRRNNPQMYEFAERLAAERGWRIVEISLRADRASEHRVFYEAGVEEFLSLVRYAEFVVTNSFHGMVFSVQFQREFVVFSREQSDTKIGELLELLGLSDRRMTGGTRPPAQAVGYQEVSQRLLPMRQRSRDFLRRALSAGLQGRGGD